MEGIKYQESRVGKGSTLDYLEIGTHTYETLSGARGNVTGLSVDMVNEYVATLEKEANRSKHFGKQFVNAAVTGLEAAGNVSMFRFKARYAEMGHRCNVLNHGLSEKYRCMCSKDENNTVQQELRDMGIKIKTRSGCLSGWALASHSVGEPFYEQAKNIEPIEKAKLLCEERSVPMLTPRAILQNLNIANVLSLKIDVEGFDAKVVGAFANYMESEEGQEFRPTEFQWECKHLLLDDELQSLKRIEPFGYACSRLKFDCMCNRTQGGVEPSMRLTPELGEPVHSKK